MAIFENFMYVEVGLKVVKMAPNFTCSCFFMYIKRYRCAPEFFDFDFFEMGTSSVGSPLSLAVMIKKFSIG